MNSQYQAGKLLSPKVVKFLSAGVLNTVFGYAVYAALLYVGTPYLAALFLATIAGVIFNYFSFGRIVFNGLGSRYIFGKFIIAYSIIYGVNALLLHVLTRDFFFSPYMGQVICIPLGVVLSWILMNFWVYKND